mmetsp:Transcript_82715/g.149194  ORF Transcript_82715/g.149194 Transcript_82715/m.149194 type:complete len:332 (+) Transcript_82715:95-1090(+)
MAVKNKKMEITALRRELAGERQVILSRIAGDSGTDEGERKLQLIWQNFRIKDCTKATAVVLGTDSADFVEGKEAALANTKELFETELFPAGSVGVPLERLSSIHAHYFGAGFEKVVGVKLRKFITDNFEYDDKGTRVKASLKVLNALRKMEARELVAEEKDWAKRTKFDNTNKEKQVKIQPPPFALSAPQVHFDPDHRPRYGTTKMTPDELEDRPMSAKGMGKGGPMGMMPGQPMPGSMMGKGGPQQAPQSQPAQGGMLNAAQLAAAPPSVQKQLIGEKLFPAISRLQPQLAGKITGMMLEMDNSELLSLLDSEHQLKEKVDEAMKVLQGR